MISPGPAGRAPLTRASRAAYSRATITNFIVIDNWRYAMMDNAGARPREALALARARSRRARPPQWPPRRPRSARVASASCPPGGNWRPPTCCRRWRRCRASGAPSVRFWRTGPATTPASAPAAAASSSARLRWARRRRTRPPGASVRSSSRCRLKVSAHVRERAHIHLHTHPHPHPHPHLHSRRRRLDAQGDHELVRVRRDGVRGDGQHGPHRGVAVRLPGSRYARAGRLVASHRQRSHAQGAAGTRHPIRCAARARRRLRGPRLTRCARARRRQPRSRWCWRRARASTR